jgi:hypothetical protein
MLSTVALMCRRDDGASKIKTDDTRVAGRWSLLVRSQPFFSAASTAEAPLRR